MLEDRSYYLEKSEAYYGEVTFQLFYKEMVSKPFDWVYIDADHSFEGCLKDLESAHLKIKIDGYICGHDFLADGFTVEGFGVNKAVLQFIEKYNYKMIFLTSDKFYKSYVLCKTDNAAELFNNKLNSLK
jgi:hypothetical protein